MKITTLVTMVLVLAFTAPTYARSPIGMTRPAPQLSEQETETLVFMREEEKLARDTYLALDELWSTRVFINIATAEQQHMDMMGQLLVHYDIQDPIVDDVAGRFQNQILQDLYDTLLDQGSVSKFDSFMVGALIEEADIQDLERAIEESTHKDTYKAYQSLLSGSENHLRAFVRQISRPGVDYEAQILDQERVDEILYGF